MNPFKPGDKVRCVNNEGYARPKMLKGGVYTVNQVRRYILSVEGVSGYWDVDRFTPVTAEPKWELNPHEWNASDVLRVNNTQHTLFKATTAWACFLDWYCHINLATVKYGKDRSRLDELAEALWKRAWGDKGIPPDEAWCYLSPSGQSYWKRLAQAAADELGVEL